MDQYRRIEKPREETPISENEIRITTQGRIRNYIAYATALLQEKECNEISLKAMGRGISKTVVITELIKRRVSGLHQNTYIGSTDITDTWESLEEGLNTLETTRHVSVITVHLSKKELDTSSTGYHGPIPADQVMKWADYDHEEQGLNSTRGGLYGRGRGNYSIGVMEYNADGGLDSSRGYVAFDGGHSYGGFEGGRGYAGRGRTRGRGYGNGSMQPEYIGYSVYNG